MASPADFLPWDSEFFGVRICRARIAPGAEPADVAEHCDADGFACAYLLLDSADARLITGAQHAGFRVVDIRVTLDRPLDRSGAPSPAASADETASRVRPALPADVSRLREIARTSFTDTRFYRDGRFAPERCADLYDTWITKDCGGRSDAVLVSDGPGGATGFITCSQESAGTAQIGLVAVDASARGRKTGSQLVEAAVRWASERGFSTITVVTQGSNIAALRAYESAGFRVRRSEIWLHRWADEARPR